MYLSYVQIIHFLQETWRKFLEMLTKLRQQIPNFRCRMGALIFYHYLYF